MNKPVTQADYELHILRNPHGYSDERVRQARLWAGDRIEEVERDNRLLCGLLNDVKWYDLPPALRERIDVALAGATDKPGAVQS